MLWLVEEKIASIPSNHKSFAHLPSNKAAVLLYQTQTNFIAYLPLLLTECQFVFVFLSVFLKIPSLPLGYGNKKGRKQKEEKSETRTHPAPSFLHARTGWQSRRRRQRRSLVPRRPFPNLHHCRWSSPTTRLQSLLQLLRRTHLTGGWPSRRRCFPERRRCRRFWPHVSPCRPARLRQRPPTR